MDIEKIVLSDKEIESLPLFYKIIYHNLLIDQNYEAKLMMYNPKSRFKEMRSAIPQRTMPAFYNYTEKESKDGEVQ